MEFMVTANTGYGVILGVTLILLNLIYPVFWNWGRKIPVFFGV